ncbi:MAG: hypothetical protein AAFQ21_12240, partial [Pseudomonadota bacterium]
QGQNRSDSFSGRNQLFSRLAKSQLRLPTFSNLKDVGDIILNSHQYRLIISFSNSARFLGAVGAGQLRRAGDFNGPLQNADFHSIRGILGARGSASQMKPRRSELWMMRPQMLLQGRSTDDLQWLFRSA